MKTITNIFENGLLSRTDTAEGSISYNYFPCGGKLRSVSLTGRGVDETLVYEYDGPLATRETASGTLSQSISYSYNNDFLRSSISYAGETDTLGYDNDGLLVSSGPFYVSREFGSGLMKQTADTQVDLSEYRNGYGDPASYSMRVGQYSLYAWALQHNDVGQIVQKTESVAGQNTVIGYSYDDAGRLLTVSRDGILVEEYTYSQDPHGRRYSEVNSLRGIARTFAYNGEDQVTYFTGDTAGAMQYSVDGFLERKTEGDETTLYTYSTRGELLNVTLPDGRFVEYRHDPLGRRIAKIVDGVMVEQYQWDGLTRLLAVYDGAGTIVMRFLYADGRLPVAVAVAGGTYYLAYDQVGSLRVVSDSSGNIVDRIEYDSFGNILPGSTRLLGVPLGFAGGLHDADTGLVRFGHRDYIPEVGRFAAKDPIGFSGGDTDIYAYCLQDPVNGIDPDGLEGQFGFFTTTKFSNSILESNMFTPEMRETAYKIAKCIEKNTQWKTELFDGDLTLNPSFDFGKGYSRGTPYLVPGYTGIGFGYSW